MWSGPTRWVQPCSASAPSITSTFEPMPSMPTPILQSRWHRSCTCGSQAAFMITVVPRARAAAISAFSVPVTLASSRWISAPSRPSGARRRYSRSTSTSAPSAANAIRWVSTRRRPITSPPGGGTSAAPKRASSGPASRIEARMRVHSSGSSLVPLTSAAHTRTVFGPCHSTSTPSAAISSIISSTSRMCGTFSRMTGSPGEQAGGEDREGRVLVAGRPDGARQRLTALDQECLHSALSRRGSHGHLG